MSNRPLPDTEDPVSDSLQEVTAQLRRLTLELGALRHELAPMIAVCGRVQALTRESVDEDEPELESTRWQRWVCWWRGHEEHLANYTHSQAGAFRRCVRCGRVYKR